MWSVYALSKVIAIQRIENAVASVCKLTWANQCEFVRACVRASVFLCVCVLFVPCSTTNILAVLVQHTINIMLVHLNDQINMACFGAWSTVHQAEVLG